MVVVLVFRWRVFGLFPLVHGVLLLPVRISPVSGVFILSIMMTSWLVGIPGIWAILEIVGVVISPRPEKKQNKIIMIMIFFCNK